MKQSLIITSILFCVNTGFSQVHNHALGLRFRTSPHLNIRNTELSYQIGLNQKNRLEIGLNYGQGGFDSFKYRHLSSSIYYQHVMNIRGGLNWYVGAGLKYDLSQYIVNNVSQFHHQFSAGPTIGLEYDFNHKNIPLLLSLDYRPSLVYSPSFQGNAYIQNQFGLALRYTFKDKPNSN